MYNVDYVNTGYSYHSVCLFVDWLPFVSEMACSIIKFCTIFICVKNVMHNHVKLIYALLGK